MDEAYTPSCDDGYEISAEDDWCAKLMEHFHLVLPLAVRKLIIVKMKMMTMMMTMMMTTMMTTMMMTMMKMKTHVSRTHVKMMVPVKLKGIHISVNVLRDIAEQNAKQRTTIVLLKDLR